MKCLVTGGGGFVGKALCERLVADGHSVSSLSRGSYPELEQLGVKHLKVDIGDDQSFPSFSDFEVVFHTASKVNMWGDRGEFERTNVQGTKNVIEACLAGAVKALVYTSSPSVIAKDHDACEIDESTPYPSNFMADYPRTKSIAERLVLQANGAQELSTCALRPHLIWGPGDRNFVPTILERAKAGKLMRVGDGSNLVDVSFIDDCVEAHVLAASTLLKDGLKSPAAGKVYFISQGEPVKLWEWIDSGFR